MYRVRWKAIVISSKGPNSNEGLNVITPEACDECFVPDSTISYCGPAERLYSNNCYKYYIVPNIGGNRGNEQYTNKHTIKGCNEL